MAVSLVVNGKPHAGWKDISVMLSMQHITGKFDLVVSEKWPDGERDIKPHDACTVLIGGETLITGFVDQAEPAFSYNRHELRVSGRDKSGDLIDCSAINSPGEWSGIKMDSIAKSLCNPFAIPVSVDTNVGEAFSKFAIQQGETAFEAIERMAKLRAVLVLSDGKGGILITAASKNRAMSLVQGKNILSAKRVQDYTERFSQVIVKGQNSGGDKVDLDSMTKPKGVASDDSIRYRPRLVIAEGQINTKQAKERADWELQVKKGQSDTIELAVQGWTQQDGSLWKINTLSRVDSPFLKIKKDMLISRVNFILNEDEGTITRLQLTDPDAFALIREPEPKDD